jgi:rsbT co-antagonist protein RsbR
MNTVKQPSHRTDTMDTSEILKLYGISDEDLRLVRVLGESALPRMDEWILEWYDWLRPQPEFEQFFSDKEILDQVQRQQCDYWSLFFAAEIDQDYLERRRSVGETHARIGLQLNTYFSGMNYFMNIFSGICLAVTESNPGAAPPIQRAVTKLLHLDTAVVVGAYSEIIEETIGAQSRALMEMSTPVTQIWSDILLLPLVGIIDSHRARDIMNATLAKISETRARIFILDISGVAMVDTAVANNLIKITKATSLMGCSCTISGVSPAIAQTIVELGIDTGDIKTTATMRDALADAFRRVGMEITEIR